MKNLTRLLIIGFLFMMPATAGAQTIDSLMAQIQALMAQIQQLQAQTGGSTVPATQPTSSTTGCPSLSRTLRLGMSGSDVSSLQTFLADDPSVYPDGLVTGYFGALTQAAVQRWQARRGIVSSGDPDSTGYGLVGPKTRNAMMSSCGGSVGGTSAPGTVGGFVSIQPASGKAPLTATVTATVNTTNSCSGNSYMVDFGDGADKRQYISTAGNCSQQIKTFAHTYTNGGVYKVTLSAGGHETSAIVTVEGANAQSGSVTSLRASKTSGEAPLAVTFTGTVNSTDAGSCTGSCFDVLDFGDGKTVSIPLPARQSGYDTYNNFTIDHTYGAGGTYNALLMSGTTTSLRQTFANVPVTVTGPARVPTITVSAGANSVARGSTLNVQWSVQNIPASPAASVALWLINVQTGAVYPLANTLDLSGSFNAMVPSTGSSAPPNGTYRLSAKVYTPSDAMQSSTTPTYIVEGRSNTFDVTDVAPTAQTGTYAIGSIVTGQDGNQSRVQMRVFYPACGTFKIDWDDGSSLQAGGTGSGSCSTLVSTLVTHTYQFNGSFKVRLLDGDNLQRSWSDVSISNAGTTGAYGISTVTLGALGQTLNVSAQLKVPTCPSYSIQWGDTSSATSISAASGCTSAGGPSATHSHVYSAMGAYIITLKNASSTTVSTASIRVSTTTAQQ